MKVKIGSVRPLAGLVALAAVCLFEGFLQAEEVSRKTAEDATRAWMARNPRPLGVQFKDVSAKTANTFKDAKGRVLFYVVPLAKGGFVVTSADTRISPIIAFSGTGHFDAESANPLHALLAGDISNQLDQVTSQTAVSVKSRGTVARTAEDKWADLTGKIRTKSGASESISDVRVAPLVQSKWGQSKFGGGNTFNLYTPNNYVCGCVATAFSQIMRYWKMPAHDVVPGTYVCWVDGVQAQKTQIGGSYDWDNMPLTSGECQTDVQRQAIGHLAYDVGAASQMGWTYSGSGTWGAITAKALVERFGYASASVYWSSLEGQNINDGAENYRNAILASLDAAMPVELEIFGDGGHSVVADGYGFNGNKDVYCHINCGWSGSDDLWYNLIREEMTDYKFITLGEVCYNIHPTENGEVISGRVLDLDGIPLAEATVWLTDDGGLSKSTMTDERGVYAFRVATSGTYRLQATKSGVTSEPFEIKISALHQDADWMLDETKRCMRYSSSTVANRWGNDLTVDLSSLCIVTFNAGGGEGVMSEQTFTARVAQSLASNRFTRTGYTFAGWATQDDGDVVYGDGETVALSSDTVLYAVWKLNAYSVTFNANGGTGTMSAQTFLHGLPQALAVNLFMRTGYVFAGWALSPAGEKVYDDAQSLSLTGSLTLYAVWAGVQSKVTFDFAGGTGKSAAVTAIYGRPMPGIDVPVHAGGFEFDGFYTGPDGTGEQYYLASAESARNWDKTADITLYAKWRPVSATLWIEGDTLRSVSMNGYTEVVVPEGITTIGHGAMADCDTLETVYLPASLTEIESYAFSGCSALKEVSIPANVKTIGEEAFGDCRNLTRLSLPDGLAEIGNGAFTRCASLVAVTIPTTVTHLGREAFEDCSALTDVIVPGSVGEIQLATFSGCGSLERLTLGEGLTVIGQSAFSHCANLRSISFPSTLREIDFYAFFCCYGLTELELPEGLSNLRSSAFSYCTGLEQVIIPGSLGEIGNEAFEACTSLQDVTIREGVKMVGASAFAGCDALWKLTLPTSVESVGRWAFYDCFMLEEVVIPGGGMTTIGEYAFSGSGLKTLVLGNGVVSVERCAFWYCKNLSSVSIAEGLKEIGSSAFSDCSCLVDIALPNSVTNLGSNAFSGCTSLESIILPSGLTELENYIFDDCTSLRQIAIPDGVNAIGSGVFNHCESLSEVFLPEGVTNIANGAFGRCISLRELTLPVTLESIGDYAFEDCQSLTTLVIPAGVTEIGLGTFGGCRSLSSLSVTADNDRYAASGGLLYTQDGGELIATALAGQTTCVIPPTIREIGDSAFEDNQELTSLEIPASVQRIGDYAFSGCGNLTAVVIPSSVTDIGWGAFYDCISLTNVVLPVSIASLRGSLFYGCSALREVAIPASVTSMGNWVFGDCSSLESIDIPVGVTSVGAYAFAACDSLQAIQVAADNTSYKSVGGALYTPDGSTLLAWPGGVRQAYIPEGVKAIGERAFAYCDFLSEVSLPTTLRELGDNAFMGCAALETVDLPAGLTRLGEAFAFCEGVTHLSIPASVTSLDDWAFCYCTHLTSVVLPDTLESIGESAFENCESLVTIALPENLKNVADVAFAECVSIREIAIPGSVTNVGDGAFLRCAALEHASIEAGHVGAAAFACCSNLVSVTLGKDVASLDDGAFYECVSLERVIIPDSVTYLGASMFEGCVRLKSVTIGPDVTWLGREAFLNCTSLEEVVFKGDAPDMVQVLAFEGVSPVCVVSVPQGSTGWGVVVPGFWQGLAIRAYTPDPLAFVTVSFDANGGAGGLTQTVAEGERVGLLPTATREGAVFTGWWTSPTGGTRVESDVLATADTTFYAQWATVAAPSDPEPTPMPEPTPTPVPVTTQQTWTVTFNANGGTGTMAAQTFTNGVAQELAPNAFARFGYAFVGWVERADGEAVYADGQRIVITSGRTLYAQWAEIVAGSLDTSFATAQTLTGALYNKDMKLVGTVQVKVGKVGKKGDVKLSASATLLVDGKTKKITAKAAMVEVKGGAMSDRLTFKAPIGEMAFEMATDGTFTLKNAAYLMSAATVGGALNGGARGTFRLENFGLAVPGELQENLLPYEEEFDAAGGKWKFAKAAGVKWAKDKATKEYALVVDDTNGKTNLSSLKLTYAAKTGLFKGSFKAYALEEKSGKTKLVKYTVNVLGLVVDGVGQGEATCKKPAAGPWAVMVE